MTTFREEGGVNPRQRYTLQIWRKNWSTLKFDFRDSLNRSVWSLDTTLHTHNNGFFIRFHSHPSLSEKKKLFNLIPERKSFIALTPQRNRKNGGRGKKVRVGRRTISPYSRVCWTRAILHIRIMRHSVSPISHHRCVAMTTLLPPPPTRSTPYFTQKGPPPLAWHN